MESLFAINHSYLIPLLPLLGAAIAGFFGARWLKGNSHWPIWLGVGASAILSITLLLGVIHRMHEGSLTPANAQYPYLKLSTVAAGEHGAAAARAAVFRL